MQKYHCYWEAELHLAFYCIKFCDLLGLFLCFDAEDDIIHPQEESPDHVEESVEFVCLIQLAGPELNALVQGIPGVDDFLLLGVDIPSFISSVG